MSYQKKSKNEREIERLKKNLPKPSSCKEIQAIPMKSVKKL